MQGSPLLILLLFLCHSISARSVDTETEKDTQLQNAEGNMLTELSSLEDTMNVLNALSVTQKELLGQQRTREERILSEHQEENAREESRSKTLAAGQKMLEEIRGKVYRKIKNLNKKASQGEKTNAPKDCSDVYLEGDETSGVYTIWPLWNRDSKGFPVYCDMDTDGGGWTVIHRWIHPAVPREYFQRPWKDYKNGFGDLESAFWLGSEHIYELTNQGVYELRFDTETSGSTSNSTYSSFFIGDEDMNYKLHIGEYVTGIGGDIFRASNGANFSTYDQNNMPLTRKVKDGPVYWDAPSRIEYVQPECTEKDVGWWHKDNCKVDSKIHPTSHSLENAKMEMKIRHSSFITKKEIPA